MHEVCWSLSASDFSPNSESEAERPKFIDCFNNSPGILPTTLDTRSNTGLKNSFEPPNLGFYGHSHTLSASFFETRRYRRHCQYFPAPPVHAIEQEKSARLSGSFSGCSRRSTPSARPQGAVRRGAGGQCEAYGRSKNGSRFSAEAASCPVYGGVIAGNMGCSSP